jgi:NAD(P)-dependent dehydrogenase (short-subunit alcohol dehydrogenase family)
MDKFLSGRVAVVTGASRGIGRAAALALGGAGADLALCARGRELESVAREAAALGVRVMARRCDVADRSAVRAWLRAAARRLGRLDILVNNAGMLGPRAALAGFPAEDFGRVLDVNVGGVLHATQAALEFSMLKRRSGVIINVSSGAGRVGDALGGAYTVSKFALEGMTQVAARELHDSGICVVSFIPGVVRTRMRAAWAPDEDPMTLKTPDTLAKHFLKLAGLDLSRTGRCFAVSSTGKFVEIGRPEARLKK